MPKMKIPDSLSEAKQTGEAKPESASTKIGTSLALFLQLPGSELNLEGFSKYRAYYDRTWAALKQGDPPESDIMISSKTNISRGSWT
jgi:hypothetical protein